MSSQLVHLQCYASSWEREAADVAVVVFECLSSSLFFAEGAHHLCHLLLHFCLQDPSAAFSASSCPGGLPGVDGQPSPPLVAVARRGSSRRRQGSRMWMPGGGLTEETDWLVHGDGDEEAGGLH